MVTFVPTCLSGQVDLGGAKSDPVGTMSSSSSLALKSLPPVPLPSALLPPAPLSLSYHPPLGATGSKTHRGEPGHTRDTRDTRSRITLTDELHNQPVRPANAHAQPPQPRSQPRGRLRSNSEETALCPHANPTLPPQLPESPQTDHTTGIWGVLVDSRSGGAQRTGQRSPLAVEPLRPGACEARPSRRTPVMPAHAVRASPVFNASG